MIMDNIKNAPLYFGLGKRIEKALTYLQTTDFNSMEVGKYEIDGKEIYAIVKLLDTQKPDPCHWEAHHKYIDIHYVFDGIEDLGYVNLLEVEKIGDYDKDEDIYFLQGHGNMLNCKPGMFIIFGTEDAHMPAITQDQPQTVRKVVVKVKV